MPMLLGDVHPSELERLNKSCARARIELATIGSSVATLTTRLTHHHNIFISNIILMKLPSRCKLPVDVQLKWKICYYHNLALTPRLQHVYSSQVLSWSFFIRYYIFILCYCKCRDNNRHFDVMNLMLLWSTYIVPYIV